MRSQEPTMSKRDPVLEETEMDKDFWIKDQTEDKKLEDEYLLGDVIGRGNSSVVYKCLRKGRTEWACKILKKKQLNKKSVQTHLRSLLKLKHPNIVNLKEVFETQDEIQLILELARGGELFERIVERGVYSEEDAAKAVRHILNALQYLHSQGIIHRDLKPENLLYQTEMEDSVLKLADYGMHKLLSDDHFLVSRNCGAFGYSAPEVLLNKEINSSIDLWSVGVITFTMLCGFEPFWDDGGEGAMSRRIIEGDYSFPSPWWDDISDSAKDLVSKLLSIDPSRRPTAEEALNHPWTLGIAAATLHMNQTIIKLKELNARRRFRVATKAVLATRRAFKMLSPSRKIENHCDKRELKCYCVQTQEDTSKQNGGVEESCHCSLLDGSVGKTSNELMTSLPIDGGANEDKRIFFSVQRVKKTLE